MTLATRCPHCQTTYRVAQDQLKLRAGLVRCGYCKDIFNGVEHLLPPDDAAYLDHAKSSSALPPTVVDTPSAFLDGTKPTSPDSETETAMHFGASAASSAADVGIPKDDEHDSSDPAKNTVVQPLVAPAESQAAHDSDLTESTDPLQRMTLLDFTRELPEDLPERMTSHSDGAGDAPYGDALLRAQSQNQSNPNGPDELDKAIEDLQRRPWRNTKRKRSSAKTDVLRNNDVEVEEEPAFLKKGRHNRTLSKKLRIGLMLGSIILLIAALVQCAYLFRNQLASSFPQIKPALIKLCEVAGCRIDLPAQIADVSIESSELQTLADNKDRFVLTTLLRNYSDTPQEWPHIELTLNDANEKPLLRRIFPPGDYLATATDSHAGIAPNSERSVKLTFQINGTVASGYRVYLFYP